MEPESIFLHPDELVQLTGYQHKREQVRYLSQLGVKFLPDRWGKPKVSRRAVEEMLGGRPDHNAVAVPDIEAMRGVFGNGQTTNNT